VQVFREAGLPGLVGGPWPGHSARSRAGTVPDLRAAVSGVAHCRGGRSRWPGRDQVVLRWDRQCARGAPVSEAVFDCGGIHLLRLAHLITGSLPRLRPHLCPMQAACTCRNMIHCEVSAPSATRERPQRISKCTITVPITGDLPQNEKRKFALAC
jgi:poly(3-hydroxybutyrate) depolymerase